MIRKPCRAARESQSARSAQVIIVDGEGDALFCEGECNGWMHHYCAGEAMFIVFPIFLLRLCCAVNALVAVGTGGVGKSGSGEKERERLGLLQGH